MRKTLIRHLGVRLKLFVVVIVVFSVPLSAMLAFTYQIMRDDQQERMMTLYQTEFSQSVQSVEKVVNELYTLAYRMDQALWFRSLLHAQTDSDLYTGAAQYDLYRYNDHLVSYAILNDAFQNILIYFPGRDYIMTSMGILYVDEVPQRLFSVSTMTDEQWRELTQTRTADGFSSVQQVSHQGMTSEGVLFKFAFPVGASYSMRASMIVFVETESLLNQISPIFLQAGYHLRVVVDDHVICQWAWDENLQTPANAQELTYEDHELHMQLLIEPEMLVVNVLRGLFIGLFVLIWIVGALLAWIVAERFYRPFNLLLQKLGRNEKNVQEFKVIEAEIANLVSKEQELKARLKLQRPLLLNALLGLMLHEQYIPSSESTRMLELLRISFPHPYLAVATLHFEKIDESGIVEQRLLAMRDATMELYYAWEGEQLAIIGNFIREEAFKDMLQRLSQSVIAESAAHFVIGVSLGFTEISQVTRAYEQAEKACDQGYWGPSDHITAFVETSKTDDAFRLDEMLLTKIKDAVFAGQATLAVESLEHVFEELRTPATSPKFARAVLARCYGIFVNIAATAQMQNKIAVYAPLEICFANDAKRLVALVKALAHYAAEQLVRSRDNYVHMINQYVENNLFNPDLSLAFLADQFNYTTPYVSKLFKDLYKINFLEYVMGKRIEKAKELLKTTDLPIALIGQEVGFGSEISFRRQFKKTTDTTPSYYRMIHQRNAPLK